VSVDRTHPHYDRFVADWLVMRDTYAGERCVKDRSIFYLPPTEGMIRDGALSNLPVSVSTAGTGVFGYGGYTGGFGLGYPVESFRTAGAGWRRYQQYLRRAVFYDFVGDAVKAAIGVMHHKPPTIELPAQMESLRDKATLHGESLDLLIRKIHVEQLVVGRAGLLLTFPQGRTQAAPDPYLVVYPAEQCLNWDDGSQDDGSQGLPSLNLVVIDESAEKRKGFEWERKTRYRVLVLGSLDENESKGQGAYSYAVMEEKGELDPAKLFVPTVRGQTAPEIPFVFVNTMDLVGEPDQPPLRGLAALSLAIYRGDADYRYALYEQSNATLVRIGAISGDDDEVRVGTGASLDLPHGGDAKYIVAPSEGLGAQREALRDDKMQAAHYAGTLLDTRGTQREAAETHRIRARAQHASLTQIAQTAASAVEHLLKSWARWIGADDEQVSVVPNLDFDGAKLSGEDLVKFLTAKTLGAPLSKRSIHSLMRQGELTDLDYDEEIAELEGESDLPGGTGVSEETDDDPGPAASEEDDDEEGEDG